MTLKGAGWFLFLWGAAHTCGTYCLELDIPGGLYQDSSLDAAASSRHDHCHFDVRVSVLNSESTIAL